MTQECTASKFTERPESCFAYAGGLCCECHKMHSDYSCCAHDPSCPVHHQPSSACRTPAVPVEVKHPASIAMIVRSDGRLLTVTNRKYDSLAFPGGKLQPPETPKIACCRELCEETGLIAYPLNLRLVHTAHGTVESDRLVRVYYVHEVVGWAHAVEPGTEMLWLTLRELCERSRFGPFYAEAFPDGTDYFRETKGAG